MSWGLGLWRRRLDTGMTSIKDTLPSSFLGMLASRSTHIPSAPLQMPPQVDLIKSFQLKFFSPRLTDNIFMGTLVYSNIHKMLSGMVGTTTFILVIVVRG